MVSECTYFPSYFPSNTLYAFLYSSHKYQMLRPFPPLELIAQINSSGTNNKTDYHAVHLLYHLPLSDIYSAPYCERGRAVVQLVEVLR